MTISCLWGYETVRTALMLPFRSAKLALISQEKVIQLVRYAFVQEDKKIRLSQNSNNNDKDDTNLVYIQLTCAASNPDPKLCLRQGRRPLNPKP